MNAYNPKGKIMNDLIYRPYDLINHEIIINGIRFTYNQIQKAKATFRKQYYQAKKLKQKLPQFLIFNLKFHTITIG